MNLEARKKCHKHSIRVYPVAIDKGAKNPRCKIEIEILGKTKLGNEIYNQDKKMWDKIEELYSYLASKC